MKKEITNTLARLRGPHFDNILKAPPFFILRAANQEWSRLASETNCTFRRCTGTFIRHTLPQTRGAGLWSTHRRRTSRVTSTSKSTNSCTGARVSNFNLIRARHLSAWREAQLLKEEVGCTVSLFVYQARFKWYLSVSILLHIGLGCRGVHARTADCSLMSRAVFFRHRRLHFSKTLGWSERKVIRKCMPELIQDIYFFTIVIFSTAIWKTGNWLGSDWTTQHLKKVKKLIYYGNLPLWKCNGYGL